MKRKEEKKNERNEEKKKGKRGNEETSMVCNLTTFTKVESNVKQKQGLHS